MLLIFALKASGVAPFRGKSNYCNEAAIWSQRIYTTATREIFRKDPLEWYNNFWLPFMTLPPYVRPNEAHRAMDWLLKQSEGSDANLRIQMITQNVDGLIAPNSYHSIEAHGRIGLFKCIPDEDSDTDSESDEDSDRPIHLGHRRKWRKRREQNKDRDRSTSISCPQPCPYQHEKSLSIDQIKKSSIKMSLRRGNPPLLELPKCPHCRNTLLPQALLFDEGYHSHDFYEFLKMEKYLFYRMKSLLLQVK